MEHDCLPSPPDGKPVKVEEEHHVSLATRKKGSSLDRVESMEEQEEEGKGGGIRLPSPAQADLQRAHLVKSVPHLFGGDGSNGHQSSSLPDSPVGAFHTTTKANSRSPSSSTRPSPNPSEDESVERAGSHGLVSAGESKSRHSVPKGFRGPLPRLQDAEDIAPLPTLIPSQGSRLFNTLNYPYNRNGYHYVSAGPASERLPMTVYKTLETSPRGIHWSWSDRSPFTLISQDGTIVGSDRGFRSARGNVPVREGSWYVELHILTPEGSSSMKDGPHVRLGWGRREAGVNAPVGINGYSYGVRDTTGEKVFLSRAYPYSTSFGPGDVVGMYISLPEARKVNERDAMDPARINRKRIPIRYKGRLYFETLEYPMSKEMEHLMDRSRRGEKLRGGPGEEETFHAATGMLAPPQMQEASSSATKKKRKPAPGAGPGLSSSQSQASSLRALPTLGPESQIGFFINGQPQGVAFENLLDFRPLRRQASSTAGAGSAVKKTASSSFAALSEEGVNESSVITTSSSLASILKSRENFFDDGSLGYFPFVSLFGGARVQIVSRAQDFRYPPPDDVRAALEEADRSRGRGTGEGRERRLGGRCRPLEERYDEYLNEVWKHDLADEERAKAVALLKHARDNDDEEDDEESTAAKTSAKASAKKGRKRATPGSHSNSPKPATTALREEEQLRLPLQAGEGGARSGIRVEIKSDEDQELIDVKQEVDTPMEIPWCDPDHEGEPMQVDEPSESAQ